jgi:hypothetical protein
MLLRMPLLQLGGEPYPRFVCDLCDRKSDSQEADVLLAAGWRAMGFQTYICPLCMRIGTLER